MSQRNTQREKIKDYLWARFGEWVPLPEILPFAAQYSARIHEMRKELGPRGYAIENRTEIQADGSKRSWFKLDYAAAIDVTPPKPAPAAESDYMRRVREEQERATPLFAGGTNEP
ncbi:MAG TPA: hypothetical protein VJN92_22850 [Candidatus Acidoferrum sp.]|nr:hypothetical protein [Candidatus Acidoferrum sp.]